MNGVFDLSPRLLFFPPPFNQCRYKNYSHTKNIFLIGLYFSLPLLLFLWPPLHWPFKTNSINLLSCQRCSSLIESEQNSNTSLPWYCAQCGKDHMQRLAAVKNRLSECLATTPPTSPTQVHRKITLEQSAAVDSYNLKWINSSEKGVQILTLGIAH